MKDRVKVGEWEPRVLEFGVFDALKLFWTNPRF